MKRIWLLFSILFVIILGFILQFMFAPKNKTTLHITSYNKELQDEVKNYNFTLTNKETSLNKITAIAEKRKIELEKQLKTDPEVFLENTLSEKEISQIPKQILDQGLIEQKATIEGEYVITHYDNLETKTTHQSYEIRPEKGNSTKRLETYFIGPIPNAESGSKVNVTGTVLGENLVVADSTGTTAPTSFYVIAPPPTPTGIQKIAVIMFNFINDRREPENESTVRGKLLTNTDSVNAFMRENSFEAVSVTADFFGYYTIPYEVNTGSCNSVDWAIAANSAAFQHGVDVTAYSRFIYIFPRSNDCYYGAWATIGGSPSYAWIPEIQSTSIFAHELGHNLGLYHSNTFVCGNQQAPDFVNIYEQCRSIEYGDWYDNMATSYNHFNAAQKKYLGWITPDQTINATSSGTFTISNIESASTIPKVIEIQTSNSNYNYYVSYRRPVPQFDQNLPPGVTSGAQIHIKDTSFYGSPTFLLDMTPEATSSSDYNNLSNSALIDGMSFRDNVNQITVKQISHTPGTVTLTINLNTTSCRHQTPSLTVTPPSRSGSRNSQIYNVALQNNDTSNCSPSNFSINSYVLGNMQTSLNQSNFLLSPGAVAYAVLTVIPNANIALGNYKIIISVYSNEPRHIINTTATLNLIGTISKVEINPPTLTTILGKPGFFSALAYDTTGQPIWSGVTYDWGISSQTTIGTLSPNYNIATFTPLNIATGQLFVNASYGDEQVTGSVLVTVSDALPSPTPTKSPTLVSNPPTSPKPTPSPTTIEDIKEIIGFYMRIYNNTPYGIADDKTNSYDFAEYLRWFKP